MSTKSKTTKPAPKTSKTTATKGKKPAAKSTMTAATAKTPDARSRNGLPAIAAPKQVPIVATMGQMIDTQEIANRLGRNWQFVNRQRHAGAFIDHSAVLKTGGTYLYKVSAVRSWAKQNGYPFAN